MQPLPLVILTGFLGSGKTSTLRHWLEKTSVPLKRVAVLINDFGSVNVDAALLARRQLELRSITGGCVCCQSFEEMVDQILLLADNPELDLVWIETSGLADPEEVFDHLSVPDLQKRAIVRRLILVIDASDFPCSWRGRAVQEEQIRYADLIILNKTDRVSAAAKELVEETLRRLNPGAKIVSAEHGRVEPELLSGAGTTAMRPHTHDHDDDHQHHDHEHDHAHEDEELPHSASTLFLPLPAPVSRQEFQRFLDRLPKAVFRAKGFIRFTESPEQLHTFQKVRDQAELVVLPLDSETTLTGGVVLIGPHLDARQIRELAETSIPLAAPLS